MYNSSEFYNKLYQVSFTNQSKFPIVVESWVHVLDGLSSMKEFVVKQNQTVDVTSVTGEWYLHNMLSDPSDFNIWESEGFVYTGRVGKFQLDAAANGKFAWFDCDRFNIKKEKNNFIFTHN